MLLPLAKEPFTPPTDRDMLPSERREFVHLSQTFDSWWRLDGELGPENGALVAALVHEHVDKALRAQRDGDPSLERLPVSSLPAEALVDLVAQHQRRDPDDKSVADRYRPSWSAPTNARWRPATATCTGWS